MSEITPLDATGLKGLDFPVFEEELRRREIVLAVDHVRAQLEAVGKNNFHLGLVLDGGRRLTKILNKPPGWGHERGADLLHNILLPLLFELGTVKELSLFVLSHSNLQRPREELDMLQDLFESRKQSLLERAHEYGIFYRVAGDLVTLDPVMPRLLAGMKDLVRETRSNTNLRVNFCANYDTEQEQLMASNSFLEERRSRIMAILSDPSLNSAQKLVEMKRFAEDGFLIEDASEIREKYWIKRPMHFCIRPGANRLSGFVPQRAGEDSCQLLLTNKLLGQMDRQYFIDALFWYALSEQREGR